MLLAAFNFQKGSGGDAGFQARVGACSSAFKTCKAELSDLVVRAQLQGRVPWLDQPRSENAEACWKRCITALDNPPDGVEDSTVVTMAVADSIASVTPWPAGVRLWMSFILYDAARASTFWEAFELLATHFLFDAHICDLKAQCDSILAQVPEGADPGGATPEGDLPVWRVRHRLQMYLAYSRICKVEKSDRMDAARGHWKPMMKFMGSEKADQEPIWTNAVQTATKTNNSGRHVVKVSDSTPGPSPPIGWRH